MEKFTYFAKTFPESVLARTNPVYLYYIPAIDEHIWVCRDCRLKYWESILQKKWQLVDRKPEGAQVCMACSEEGSESPAAGHSQDEITLMLPTMVAEWDWIVITVNGETWINNSSDYATELFKLRLDAEMQYAFQGVKI